MFSWVKNIFSPKLSPMNIVYVHKKNILHNMEYLSSLQPNSKLFPVLKSNAYGHWIKEMVKILSKVDTNKIVAEEVEAKIKQLEDEKAAIQYKFKKYQKTLLKK